MDKTIKTIKVQDMACINCQTKIEKELKQQDGIIKVKASFAAGEVVVTYDRDRISLREIQELVTKLGYPVIHHSSSAKSSGSAGRAAGTTGREQNRTVAILAVIVIGYLVLREFGFLDYLNIFPEAEAGMGYGMLFAVGIMTSFHCMGMCGGLNLSQSIGREGGGSILSSLRPGFLYNFGRVISYTVLGGIIGGIGSVISLTGAMRGLVQLLAGLFMVIMALGILNVAPIFKKLTPHLPVFLHKLIYNGGQGKGPLIIGLLNGFMPCGPLQAMQLYALSTGSPVKGALAMLVFSLGTLPVMLSLSALGGLLTVKLKRAFIQASAFLVLILGISMFSQGMALSGFSAGRTGTQVQLTEDSSILIEDGVQKVTSTVAYRGYQGITVAAGIPVEWTIDVPEGILNGCNYRIYIPDYGIEKVLQTGENIIEFYPEAEGTVNFSCWMGMIRSKITITAALDIPNSSGNNRSGDTSVPAAMPGPGEGLEDEPEADWENLFSGATCC